MYPPLPPSIPDDRRNVLGQPLVPCSLDPKTGFYRSGCCETGPDDIGIHTICCVMTEGFLAYSRRVGNDLATPVPVYGFPGLKPGDRWCLCVARWREAMIAGVAPPVVLEATHEETLAMVTLAELERYAVKPA